VVAEALDRRWVMCELDETYCEALPDRLADLRRRMVTAPRPVDGPLGTASVRAADHDGPGMSVPRDILRENPGIGDWCVLHGWRGSIAHGMYVPSNDPDSIDDKDTMAVCVPPIDHYFGLKDFGSRGTQEIKRGEWDIVVYEIRKMIRLLAQGNPNVLSLLWLKPNLYLKRTETGEMLIENRDLFVGRHVYMPFIGYAKGQLHRMTHFPDVKQAYMGEKRARLVERHGYDTKNAAHLIRILRMGIEFLRDGELIVDRGGYDATELLEIKRGEWPIEKVTEEADRLFKRADDTYDRCSLPTKPDAERVNRLCVEVVRAAG
jgi:predicted nucleotidyltransferase